MLIQHLPRFGINLLTLAFFAIVAFPFSQPVLDWKSQSSGVLAKLSAAFFIDHNHGWVIGSNGTLLITENGGASWQRKRLPERESKQPLLDVWRFDGERGCVLGEYGVFNRREDLEWNERVFLLRSADGGANWQPAATARLPVKRKDPEKKDVEKSSPDPVLLRLTFASDRTGWAVGELGTIQSTRDGGATWQMQYALTRKLLHDIAAIDDQRAWIVGAGGVVLHTTDGGQSWSEQVAGTAASFRAVHFVDARRGWAVGANGVIFATTNGGARWQPQNSETRFTLNDVIFVNPNEGWIAGHRGTLLHTMNGGASWQDESLNTHGDLNRLFFLAPDCGWVVGTNGVIFKFGTERN